MTIQNMVIEVTRLCDMGCKHCLRGAAQNCNMTKKIIDEIFRDIKQVDFLTFTGGEPFMNIDIIEYTLEVCKEKCIEVRSVYVVTNGKHFEERYIQVMNAWVAYTISCNFEYTSGQKVNHNSNIIKKSQYGDECDFYNYGGLSVSIDKYHEPIPFENYIRYRMLGYYNHQKEHDSHYNLINEGRAKENGIATINRGYADFDYDLYGEYMGFVPDNVIIDTLYVSSLGEIVADCDMSYKTIAKMSIGNITEDTLFNILYEYFKDEFEEEREVV